MNAPTATVVVVGMGPVGMTAALSLARRGVEVTVLEAGSDLATESRASTFHPPSLQVLAELGVVDELLELGLQAPGFQYRGHSRELVAHLDMSVLAEDTPFPFRVQCEQSKLTRIIRRHLEQLPNVTLRFDAPVQRAEIGTGCARLFLPGDTFEPSITADWVLAADGSNSAVRRTLGIAFEGVTYPERFLVASTTHDFAADMPGLAPVSYVYDPDDWGVLLRTPSHWRVLFPIVGDQSDAEALDPEHIQRRLQGVVPQPEPYPVVHSTIYSVHQRLAATFGLGRVLLLGDAAHINNPLGGMGMNSGIHDAHAAVEAVTYALAGGDPERAVATYARVRKDAAQLDVQKNTQKNYEEMRQTDTGRRTERFQEMVGIAADPARSRAYLRVASMLASFETSCRRMRRGLTPLAGPAPRPAGQLMSDALREWTLPGTPEGLLTAAVLPPVAAGTDELVAAVASSPVPVVAALPEHGEVAELVARCERAGVAAVEVTGTEDVAAAVAARRDALVMATVDASSGDIQALTDEVSALVAAGADVVALTQTADAGLVGKIHLGEKAVPLAVTGQSLPDRTTLCLAGVGLVLDRETLATQSV
ncbi:FAD-dependent oxidoreductase [Nocardia higoensis]|uniref:FAD-dependent oxidoreductase n=1 Tax=Nocardia higoensis TaxID=228599 RepID=UPI001FE2376A|nr:NAD(P)/FAD-dependent oxidoreductase [Nocardia higoensis]